MSEQELNFTVPEGSGVVTNMSGHTVEYLRDYLITEGLEVPTGTEITIFNMGLSDENADAILHQAEGISYQKTDSGLRILQGLILTVTDDYVLSGNDVVVQFAPTESS